MRALTHDDIAFLHATISAKVRDGRNPILAHTLTISISRLGYRSHLAS